MGLWSREGRVALDASGIYATDPGSVLLLAPVASTGHARPAAAAGTTDNLAPTMGLLLALLALAWLPPPKAEVAAGVEGALLSGSAAA